MFKLLLSKYLVDGFSSNIDVAWDTITSKTSLWLLSCTQMVPIAPRCVSGNKHWMFSTTPVRGPWGVECAQCLLVE